ncbi:SMP-30/gluconolactonase/LRE family protein [Thermomicrobiaceae bacterium CFH 74404]|uniref:SMP-30/gluconolactonase/LRE family protein n=1 Tax=Thermalbibacter longus TaxID=2951981 RepID=A0AA42BBQ9_9BACT|nr:SMP-30/gluconolactonase/LRE family protein [Thermalbibacter longus]MCM8750030.1 SMP-30/gluconolactonase/LRE family protein [Thermalbibacter longus]
MPEIELIADYGCVVGEGPMWHPLEQCLYWLDIPMGKLFRFDPASGKHEHVYEAGEAIGGFTVQADGSLLLFMARGAIKTWRAGQVTTIIDEIPEERHTRFNDVVADPAGRVYGGTMATADRPGRLYRVDLDGSLTVMLDAVGIPNGMDFTLDLTRMYFTDSASRAIHLFDYDQATGALSNQRVWIETPRDRGVPDGLTVDSEGYVWSARWDDGALYRYTPSGEVDQRIEFPARKVSSVVFGGPDYRDVYVTTAGGDNKPVEGPGAGALFRLRPGIQGRPPFLSRIRL